MTQPQPLNPKGRAPIKAHVALAVWPMDGARSLLVSLTQADLDAIQAQRPGLSLLEWAKACLEIDLEAVAGDQLIASETAPVEPVDSHFLLPTYPTPDDISGLHDWKNDDLSDFPPDALPENRIIDKHEDDPYD